MSIDTLQLKAMNAVSKKALNEVLRQETAKIVQQEAKRIGKALVAQNRKQVMARIERMAHIALRKTLRDMRKNFSVELYFN